MSLSAQREIASQAETERQLAEARDALLGFAAVNGRLPCPAAPGTNGSESPSGGGVCTNPWDGFLPAVTLGLTPVNAQGYSVDAWNNPIRYAVTTDKSSQVTTSGQIKVAWGTGSSALAADLQVCNTSSGATGSGNSAACATGTALTNTAVAVILSRGKNGAIAPSSADEIANGNADRLVVAHTPMPPGANEFDDIVTWLSPSILYNRMIAAGRLP